MTDQFWLWLGFAGMSAGATLILFTGKSKTPKEGMTTILHGIVPIIAACSYLAMAAGQGSIIRLNDVPSADPQFDFYFARYIDWLFTTPILLTALTMTAMYTGMHKPGLLVGIILSDVIMIVTALFFGLTGVAWIKWTWFAISCGAFLAIYYVIWGPLRAEAERQRADVRDTYKINAAILPVVWFVYPIILLIDPEGLRWIGSTASVALIAVTDLTAKVGYGLFSTARHSKIADADVAEGANPRTPLHDADSTVPVGEGARLALLHGSRELTRAEGMER